jgi:hypothetical protein
MTRDEMISGLRAIADLLEAKPELGMPSLDRVDWDVWPHMVDDIPSEVARLARLIPTKFTKNNPTDNSYDEDYYTLSGNVGGMPVRILTYREKVCTKVVTGTETITTLVPAPDAPMVKVTHDREIFEWVCEPLLAKAVGS